MSLCIEKRGELVSQIYLSSERVAGAGRDDRGAAGPCARIPSRREGSSNVDGKELGLADRARLEMGQGQRLHLQLLLKKFQGRYGLMSHLYSVHLEQLVLESGLTIPDIDEMFCANIMTENASERCEKCRKWLNKLYLRSSHAARCTGKRASAAAIETHPSFSPWGK